MSSKEFRHYFRSCSFYYYCYSFRSLHSTMSESVTTHVVRGWRSHHVTRKHFICCLKCNPGTFSTMALRQSRLHKERTDFMIHWSFPSWNFYRTEKCNTDITSMSSGSRLLKYFIMIHVCGTFDHTKRFIKHEYLFPTI